MTYQDEKNNYMQSRITSAYAQIAANEVTMQATIPIIDDHSPIDIVISHVNNNDKVWQKSYTDNVGKSIDIKRFRNWNTLPYLINGIKKFMPWYNNIYVVVSNKEQVGDDVRKTGANVITHDKFIPKEYLPTFNSNTIEANLFRIPKLSEKFIYFNDDMFPIAPMRRTDFFQYGMPNYKVNQFYMNMEGKRADQAMFARISQNCDRLASKLTNTPFSDRKFIRPQHCCLPYTRRSFKDVWKLAGNELAKTMSRIRNGNNYTQYLFGLYAYYRKGVNSIAIPYRYSAFDGGNIKKCLENIESIIKNRQGKIICINDAGIDNIDNETFVHVRDKVIETLRNNLKK